MRESVPSGTASATASFNSSPFPAQSLYRLSCVMSASDVVTGSAVIQASNQSPSKLPATVGDFVDIPATSQSLSGSGLYLVPTTELSYCWVRLAFSGSSGSLGNLSWRFKTNGSQT